MTRVVLQQANKKSSEVSNIIKPGRRVKIEGHTVTGSRISITFDDSLFACSGVVVKKIIHKFTQL